MLRRLIVALVTLAVAAPAFAQQRPLKTEDPETIGAGRILIEAGFDFNRDQFYPVPGLRGKRYIALPVGISMGVSSIAEIQIDGGPYQKLWISERRPGAPLTGFLQIEGDSTDDVDDIYIGAKVRLISETARRPAIGSWFTTRLPNAGNESGLGKDVQDFASALTIGKTVRSVRVVANIGMLMLGNPARLAAQDDLLIYSLSVARAVNARAEVVGEFAGRANFGNIITPGAEDRGLFRFGARYTVNSVRLDTGVLLGLTSRDPEIGFTAGFTFVFNGIHIP